MVGSWGLVVLLGACATANTPQQDLAWDRWVKCKSPYANLLAVDLDGRITFRFTNSGERREIFQCLANAGGAGPPLPEPVAVGLPGGP